MRYYWPSRTSGPPGPAGAQGKQGPKGDQGIQGTGFSLTSRGDYNMLGTQIKGMTEGTSFNDAFNDASARIPISGVCEKQVRQPS